MMVQLDDIGIDFTTIDEYDLFLLLVGTLKEQDTSLVFADLDLKRFQAAVNEQNGNIVLVDESSGVVIDRAFTHRLPVRSGKFTILRRIIANQLTVKPKNT